MFCFCSLAISQDSSKQNTLPTKDTIIDGKIVSKSAMISPMADSLALQTLEDYQPAIDMDLKWIQELYSNSLFDSIYDSVTDMSFENIDYPELPTDTLKARLEILSSKTPFNVEYNPSLENVIKSYLKNRRELLERLMGCLKKSWTNTIFL